MQQGSGDAGARSSSPDVSVVIPTFNRSSQLMRVLEALVEQRAADGTSVHFEVVVVSDGSTDDTAQVIADYAPGFDLTFIEQENAGPAAARNRGVEAARARLILFIDDDVVPAPECVAAHIDRQASESDLVVIGPMLTPTDAELSPWVAWEQRQLEKQYRSFDDDDSAHHRQFYTGNASLPIDVFRRVGGFDPAFRRAEDVELAQRLDRAGCTFVFEKTARGTHYAERSLEAWQKIAHDYGRNDIVFGLRDQNDILTQVRGFFSERPPAYRGFVRLLVPHRRVSDLATRFLSRFVAARSASTPERVTRGLLSALYSLRYYGGVRDELGGGTAFRALLAGRTVRSSLVVWFVLEQTLGHITHAKNLQSLVPKVDGVRPVFLPIDAAQGRFGRYVPGWSNWTVRAGLRARWALRRQQRDGWTPSPDVLLVHSQVPAILLGRWMKRIPTVVSLDATPMQYDELGASYAHEVGSGSSERLKKWANERCFARSAGLITWSQWAKDGLVDQYGVDAADVTVIAPGVDVERWAPADSRGDDERALRVLFVGGDLKRKGGDLLLEAARRLREEPGTPDFDLHLVTPADVQPEAGIVVHPGLTANSPELISLYREADVFCLPTSGDCLPMVLAEAGATGLPLISTDVGAISEVVRNGETGVLIEPGDVGELTDALRSMLSDPEFRARAGQRAHTLVSEEHDARKNAGRMIDVLRRAVAPC